MADHHSLPTLDNTANDARALATTLSDMGFDVETLIGAPKAQAAAALTAFAFRAETADLALIHYAGHGVSVQGTTFPVPVDAKVRLPRQPVFPMSSTCAPPRWQRR